jgi:hypothetical protein
MLSTMELSKMSKMSKPSVDKVMQNLMKLEIDGEMVYEKWLTATKNGKKTIYNLRFHNGYSCSC